MSDKIHNRPESKFFETVLIPLVGLQALLMLYIFQHRLFNFDEFQVLYASASLVRGKALYHDRIETHFPLVNILFFFLMKIYGFKATTPLLARAITVAASFFGLFFIYKIASMIRGKETGLLAVALTLSSMVFVNKGIEVRHDVFNLFFNTTGAYFAGRTIKTKKFGYLLISAIFLGLALASTQKAIVWNLGILGGLFYVLFKENGSKRAFKSLIFFSLFFILPSILSLAFLLIKWNEDIHSFFNLAIIHGIKYISPEYSRESLPEVPFLYSKFSIFGRLLYENGLFYLLSLTGIALHFFWRSKRDPVKHVIIFWAAAGLLFYIYMKRPFYQSFLPSIPALAILTAILLTDMRDRFGNRPIWKNMALSGFTVVFLLSWPAYLVVTTAIDKKLSMSRQMENLSFCVDNLKPQERVLCFSQQQIYFDPVIRVSGDQCGSTIYSIEESCFEQRMVENECRVVIYDYRTRVLNSEIQKKIKEHYRPIGVGDILVPGFLLQPGEEARKDIWIPGTYFSPTSEITIDGDKATGRLIPLNRQTSLFKNPTSRPVLLLYLFHPERFHHSPGK